MYTPRKEVMGHNPVAPGQHPMPKEFLEKQIRHMSYLFANEYGMFRPQSKAAAKTFIAKQTISYKLDKEQTMEVRPANGSMSLFELKSHIEQFSLQEKILICKGAPFSIIHRQKNKKPR
jgi:polyhydroxyalkanoate synthesis regulator protein